MAHILQESFFLTVTFQQGEGCSSVITAYKQTERGPTNQVDD